MTCRDYKYGILVCWLYVIFDSFQFQVKDLKENGEYKFRVKAVNDVGVSDPLTGDTVIAKNPFSEFRLRTFFESSLK